MRKNFIKRRLRMRNTYVLPVNKEKIESVIKIQRWIKIKLWAKRKRIKLRERVLTIQRVYRGHVGRIAAEKERREFHQVAALIIQETYRKYKVEQERIREANKEACPICMDEIGIFNSIMLKCKHKLCMNCLKDLISHSISNAQTDIPIKCPLFTEGCESIISCGDEGMFSLCTDENFKKWEYWEIMVSHIPKEHIAYCPYSECGMPYDCSEYSDMSNNDDDRLLGDPYKYRILCPECMSLFCVRCKTLWEPLHRCRTMIQQLTNSEVDVKSTKYIEQHCKMCPSCNAVVEKSQTKEQEEHEKRTGLSGGTEDCHHMTCTNCKKDFCWTCLEIYRGNEYYHRFCPISDCEIAFTREVPKVARLPVGITDIKLIIVDNDNINIVKRVEWYNTNGFKINGHVDEKNPTEKSVFMTCSEDGFVLILRGLKGKYTYRQENKMGTNTDIHQVYQNSTLMQVNNRIRNLGANANLNPIFANNRIHNNGRMGNENIVIPQRNLANDPLPPPVPPRLPVVPGLRTDGERNPTQNRGRTPTQNRGRTPTLPTVTTIPTIPGLRNTNAPHTTADILERFNNRRRHD